MKEEEKGNIGAKWDTNVLAERYYVGMSLSSVCPSVCLSVCLSVRLSVRLSVCLSSVCLSVCLSSVCLSSVTLLHRSQRLELFGDVFVPPNSAGTRTDVLKFWAKIRRGSRGSCKLNTRGIFDQLYLALVRKRYKIRTAIVTMEDEYELLYCHLSNGVISNALEWRLTWISRYFERQITRKWCEEVTTVDQYKVVYDLSIGTIFKRLTLR